MPLIREEGEVLVHCSDCNGYLWAESYSMLSLMHRAQTKDGYLFIPCPYKKLIAGQMECNPTTHGWQYGRS